jgi:predicted O-methyltransferase YrrM
VTRQWHKLHKEQDQTGREWTAEDGNAAESEVLELLHGLIRVIKPRVVIETGTYMGNAAMSMAHAMKENNMPCSLDTCDTDEAFLRHAARLTDSFDFVTAHHMSGEELIGNSHNIDFAFIDSGGDRLAEVVALLPRLNEGAFVVIHDSNRAAERRCVDYIVDHSVSSTLELPTPRGLSILRVFRK